jgi:hypothetical protein
MINACGINFGKINGAVISYTSKDGWWIACARTLTLKDWNVSSVQNCQK